MTQQMRDALADAREAIASLDEDALGYASDGHVSRHWPIRDELLDKIDKALSSPPPLDRDKVLAVLEPLIDDAENKWGDPHTLRAARDLAAELRRKDE